MDLYILDKDFVTVSILDVYESFIWTDRYDEYGDFEAYFSPHDRIMEFMKPGNYIWRRDSEHLMMIKKIEITTDPEAGNHAIVTGESLEAILKNRVIAEQTILSGSLQNGIKTLLEQTIISPTDKDRKIDNFIFKETKDKEITELTLDAQYWGENLYDIIADVCYSENLGFKVTLNDENLFVFELYKGVDRSYDQEDYPYIIFSPRYDNLLNSDYVHDVDNVRNVAYILGAEPEEEEEIVPDDEYEEDEEKEEKDPSYETRVTEQITEMTGSGKGLDRKEIFVDATNMMLTYQDEETNVKIWISDEEYREELKQRGTEELAEYFGEETFDGQVQGDYQWKIGEDYFMGDIVQVENEYGMSSRCRVVEMITSEDASGQAFYPSFEAVPEEKENES